MKYPDMIGLYSPVMGSGKTTVANYLVERHGYTKVSFAAPLKDMARSLLTSMGFGGDTIEKMLHGSLKEQVIPGLDYATPRHLMQTMGTDWGRDCIQNDVWTRIAIAKSETIIVGGGRVVIDDVRFPNEASGIMQMGGRLVKIIRKGVSNTGDPKYEGALDDGRFDTTLQNNGSVNEFVASVEYILLMKGYD